MGLGLGFVWGGRAAELCLSWQLSAAWVQLTKMKETAEAFLGHPVTDAVITVPAYFNDARPLNTPSPWLSVPAAAAAASDPVAGGESWPLSL